MEGNGKEGLEGVSGQKAQRGDESTRGRANYLHSACEVVEDQRQQFT